MDIEPVGFARRHADFVAVHKRVLRGELPSIAAPALGVSRSGYLRWRLHHGIDSHPKAIPCSIFKSVERVIQDSKTRAICARFGARCRLLDRRRLGDLRRKAWHQEGLTTPTFPFPPNDVVDTGDGAFHLAPGTLAALGVTTLVLERDGVPVPLWLALQRLIPQGRHLAEIDGVAVLVDDPAPTTFD